MFLLIYQTPTYTLDVLTYISDSYLIIVHSYLYIELLFIVLDIPP